MKTFLFDMKTFLFEKQVSPEWLSLFRIGTGLILFASFVCLWPDYDALFASDALADPRLFRIQHPGGIIHPALFTTKLWMRSLYPILCLLLVAGLFTRPVAALLLLLQYSIFTSSYAAFSYGFDYLSSSCLFYCLLFPVNRYRSLDRLLFKSGPPKEKTIWLRWLQFHVCIIYFFAGFDKLLGPTWRNGEALWKALTQPGFESFFKPDLRFLATYPLLWVLGGWATLLLELSYPVFVWLRPTRKFWLWGIVGLHVSIALLMGLYFFSALMIMLNFCAFYYPYHPTPANQKSSAYSRWLHPSARQPRPTKPAARRAG